MCTCVGWLVELYVRRSWWNPRVMMMVLLFSVHSVLYVEYRIQYVQHFTIVVSGEIA